MLIVEEVMTKNPITCDHEAPLKDVALLMQENRVGSVVVLRDGKVVGLVTDRMLACDGLANGADGDTPVNECMVHDPALLHKDDNIFTAVDTLRGAGPARRVPVVNTYDELEGIVSIGDIATVTDRLLKAVMLDETQDATETARVQTGAKRFGKVMRAPTKLHELPPDEETHTTTGPTPVGEGPDKRGGVPNQRRTRPGSSAADTR